MPKSDEQKAVSVYMPLELYQQLMEFKNQENLRSDSQAINLLVERCLDGSTTPDRSKAPYQRLRQLEETIFDIASRLKQIEGTLVNNVPDTVKSTLSDNVLGNVLVGENLTVPDNVPNTILSNVPNIVPNTEDSSVPDTVLSESKLSKGLGQRSLAKRLSCTYQDITRYVTLGHFASWSKQHDPQGLSWELRDKKFYPCNLEVDKLAS